jgi:hypothetical protein
MFADVPVVQVGHHGQIGGRVEGKAPPFSPARGRVGAARGAGARREAGQSVLVLDPVFEGGRRVQNILGKFRCCHRQRDVQLLQLLLAFGRERGAMAAEVFQRPREETRADALQCARLLCGGEFVERPPQPLMQGDRGIKGAHRRLDGVPRFAQIGCRDNALEVADDAGSHVQGIGGRVQRGHGVLPGPRGRGCDRVNPGAAARDELLEGRAHMLRPDRIKRQRQRQGKQGVFRSHHIQDTGSGRPGGRRRRARPGPPLLR